MTKEEKIHYALQRFSGNLNCAQSVLAAYCDELNLPAETAEMMTSAFGAGMGEGEVCGAVSGALIVLGLKFGKVDISDVEKEEMKAIFERFKRSFEQTHGSLKCKNLLNMDLSNPEDYQKAHDKGLFKNSCPTFISDAIRLIEDLETGKKG